VMQKIRPKTIDGELKMLPDHSWQMMCAAQDQAQASYEQADALWALANAKSRLAIIAEDKRREEKERATKELEEKIKLEKTRCPCCKNQVTILNPMVRDPFLRVNLCESCYDQLEAKREKNGFYR